MTKRPKPCCDAGALRRIRKIEVGGVVVGLSMAGDATGGVQEMHLAGADSIADEILKIIKFYHYVPGPAEAAYQTALLREYEIKVAP